MTSRIRSAVRFQKRFPAALAVVSLVCGVAVSAPMLLHPDGVPVSISVTPDELDPNTEATVEITFDELTEGATYMVELAYSDTTTNRDLWKKVMKNPPMSVLVNEFSTTTKKAKFKIGTGNYLESVLDADLIVKISVVRVDGISHPIISETFTVNDH